MGNKLDRREPRGMRAAGISLGIAGLCCGPAALAQEGTASAQLQGVDVTAQHIDSAPYQAPSKAPLDAIQPTSVISQQYIQNNIAPTSNYDDIIKISPSVFSVAPNGPGLQENVALSIRGFQDGQFNVTFDGIPWGDSNDFTHHTTSYFETHDLGNVFVDRGPGGAETIGNATFGGTVALTTKQPSATTQLNPYLGGGSFNTLQGGLEFDTGELHQYGDATAFIDGTRSTSDGYLTFEGQTRENLFAKVVRPIGGNTTVTLVGMYNHIHQNVGLGATLAQVAANGPNYQLSNDPTQQNFYDYNLDEIHTDFEYIGVQSHWGDGWSLDNKVYTYAYYHTGLNGEDPNGFTSNGTQLPGSSCVVPAAGPGNFCNNDVPGEHLTNNYRSFGDLTRIAKKFAFGDLKFGLWFDNQTNLRELQEVDMTLGISTPNLSQFDATSNNSIDRLQHNQLVTAQPYAEFDWKVTDRLTITPGLKYNFFRRRTDAPVNQKTELPTDIGRNYEKMLPSLSAHYTIAPHWTAYAQVAEGFLAPNLNLFYQKNPLAADASLNPERTWNYQVGTAWQTERLTLAGDLYWINFNNLIQKDPADGNQFINSGGADYKGVEVEGTYYAGYGLSVFGNGSINSAKLNSGGGGGVGGDIAEVPEQTLAGGLIYNRYGIYGSFMDKWVGRRFDTLNSNNDQDFSPYSDLMLSAGYTMKNVLSASSISLKINVDNLLNVTKVNYLAGSTLNPDPANPNVNTGLYWTVAGRSVMATLSANF